MFHDCFHVLLFKLLRRKNPVNAGFFHAPKKYFKKNCIILFAYSKKYYICITKQLKTAL